MWRDNGSNHLALTAPIVERSDAMQTSNPDRPTYDAHLRRPAPVVNGLSAATPTVTGLLPPRVRRNYTQGANGQWRAEFTVESWHDPLTEEGISAIAEEDETVAHAITDTLAALNHRGTPETDRG